MRIFWAINFVCLTLQNNPATFLRSQLWFLLSVREGEKFTEDEKQCDMADMPCESVDVPDVSVNDRNCSIRLRSKILPSAVCQFVIYFYRMR